MFEHENWLCYIYGMTFVTEPVLIRCLINNAWPKTSYMDGYARLNYAKPIEHKA